MIRTFLIFLIVGAAISACQTQDHKVHEKLLHQNWEFSQAKTNQWHPATVPGCVHTDLMENELIKDPFFQANEDSIQWISKEDWVYRTHFYIDDDDKQYKNTDLVFEGLDTHASVKINGVPVLEGQNMFRTYEIPVQDHLKTGKNTLEITFRSPEEYNLEQAAKLSYKLPEDERVHSRKAPYHFGWDWGPKLITSGIWRPVYLRMWNEVRIDNAFLRTDTVSEEKASIMAEINVESTRSLKASLIISSPTGKFERKSTSISLREGMNNIPLTFDIPDPQLWWSNGLGEPHLYDVVIEVNSTGGADLLRERIGIRTIELVQRPDEAGQSFEFHLNGTPVFAKGANFIPLESFPSRLSPEDYEKAIDDAIKANFNMLRVWGGGIYEDDVFYDLCDENGIMVWQDFMFACALYPGDDAFLENVRHEISDNVKRLRNHPSIALWCGNNEISNGWFDWGWQKSLNYSKEDSLTIWSDYNELFHNLIPGVLKDEDPTRGYWPSSPSYGWGHDEATTMGDNHYWGVWWGMEPFSMYREKVSRFMSEFGFQSFPSMPTIEAFSLPEDRHLWSDVMRSHQKHPIGNETIERYMKRWYPEPKDFESFVYVSQVLQAEGMMDGIAAHRRAKPYSMGTLYWQFNDCWPVVSWSGRDYYGRWKALHYYVRKAYDQLFISAVQDNDDLKIFLVSDELAPVKGNLLLSLYDFDGSLLRQIIRKVKMSPNESRKIHDETAKEFLAGASPETTVLKMEFIQEDSTVAENYHYFALPKALKLEPAAFRSSVIKNKQGYQVSLTTSTLARNVYLQMPDTEGWWSDNFFEIIPGQEKVVVFETDESISDFKDKLIIRSLWDAFN